MVLRHLDSCIYSNEVIILFHTAYTNSKWKNLNKRHDTKKLLEEDIGKTMSDIDCNNAFSGQSPKAIEIKAKINI